MDHEDQRQFPDLRKLFDNQLDINRSLHDINAAMANLMTEMRVYMAKTDARMIAIELKASQQDEKLKIVETIRDKGFLYGLLALLLSGAFGGSVAHLTKKFLE